MESTSLIFRMRSRPPSAEMPSARCCRAKRATTLSFVISRNTAARRRRSTISGCYPPSGERCLCWHSSTNVKDGGSEQKPLDVKAASAFVAIKYSVRDRDLGSTVEEAIRKVKEQVKLPAGYKIDWAGEYESQKRSSRRLMLVLPVTILIILPVILYSMFHSGKWASLILIKVSMAVPVVVACSALLINRHALQRLFRRWFSRSLWRLRTNRRHINMLEYINQMRVRGHSIEEAAGRRGGPPFAADHDDDAGCKPSASFPPRRLMALDQIRNVPSPWSLSVVSSALWLSAYFFLPTLYVWIG